MDDDVATADDDGQRDQVDPVEAAYDLDEPGLTIDELVAVLI